VAAAAPRLLADHGSQSKLPIIMQYIHKPLRADHGCQELLESDASEEEKEGNCPAAPILSSCGQEEKCWTENNS